MKILVCIKQVPDTDNVTINPETGTMNREGVVSIVNPFCEFALEKALAIKEDVPDAEIIIVTMGPPQAMDAVNRCLELGADRGYLISDRVFAGSDCYATAYILSSFIKKYLPDFDLILTGKQAVDGDTAQVPAELAEFLDIPQINYCESIEHLSQDTVVVKSESETGYEYIEGTLPLLITVSKGLSYRNFPSVGNIIKAAAKEKHLINANMFTFNEELVGVNGSPTRVLKIETPNLHNRGIIVDARTDMHKAITGCISVLEKNNIIESQT